MLRLFVNKKKNTFGEISPDYQHPLFLLHNDNLIILRSLLVSSALNVWVVRSLFETRRHGLP